jgi:hypothetical protein
MTTARRGTNGWSRPRRIVNEFKNQRALDAYPRALNQVSTMRVKANHAKIGAAAKIVHRETWSFDASRRPR